MAKLFKLRIITQDKIFYEEEVSSINIETIEGRRQILATHLPLIGILIPTISKITCENKEEKNFFSSSGIIKVNTEEVLMLCDAAEWPENIDRVRAEESKARAQGRISKKGEMDIRRAKLALLRSMKRLEISIV